MLFSTLGSLHLQAQSSAVTTTPSGSKVFLEINAQQLSNELNQLMGGLSSYGSGDWNAILTNGSNPGMDVDFSGYDAKGIEDLIATGTLNADSLTLNKDASISGRLTVSGVTTVNDSLKAKAFVSFADSLEVVRAVSIGETLFVTGVTSLGDSLHVVGKVDLDAMLNVDGAATFGSSLVVAGVTTLNDSLKVNGNAGVTGTLGLDSLSVTDVINGQVNSLDNFTSDSLMEGDSNLYFSAAERTLLASLSGVLNTLDSLMAVIDGLGGASESGSSCGSPVSYQGYDYATVEIGSQCWFAENLRSTQYNDDAVIPSGLDNDTWNSTTDGAVTVYDEGGANEATNLATYGRLYNWHAVNTGKLCPTGWHVPADEEWTTLTDGLGGADVAGGKMKSSATDDPAWDGSNESGFSALPGGWRDSDNGNFLGEGSSAYWWSASPGGPSSAWNRNLNPDYDNVYRNYLPTRYGFSVRCVRAAAATASVPTVVTDSAFAELYGAVLYGTVESDGGDAVTATGFRWGAEADLSDAQDLAGSGTSGAFNAMRMGLTAGTTYYFTAFATNAEGTAYGDTLSFQTAAPSFTCGTSTVTFDGYDYETVEIGSQCWFAENLQSTSYNDDEAIQNGLDEAAWSSTTDGASAPPNGDENNVATHGLLYNWHAVNTDKLCPTGWHVPSNEEWTTLIDGLGGAEVAGEPLKASPSDSPNWNGTNESGFSGLAAGLRRQDGVYQNMGTWGYWWSTSLFQIYPYHYKVGSLGDHTTQSYVLKASGNSVRCLKDAN